MTPTLQPSSISIAIILVLVVSYTVLQIGRILGPVVGLMDHPNWRKRHGAGTPTTGSFALLASLMLFTLWYLNDDDLRIILIGAGLFFLLGLFDDIIPLPAVFKLFYQTVVTVAITIETELTIFNSTFLHSFETLDAIVALLSAVIFTILLSNALNLIDGHDGVAAGISIFTILAMVPIFGTDLENQTTLISIFIILPMLVFWVQNSGLVGRKLFLGDSGSLTLGYLISWMMIYQLNQPSLTSPNYSHFSYFLWLVFIPCVDAAAVILQRLWASKPIFQPDRSHLHHLLTHSGMSRLSVMTFILWLHVSFIGCGWLVMQYIPQWSYLVLAITALGYIATTHRYRSHSIID